MALVQSKDVPGSWNPNNKAGASAGLSRACLLLAFACRSAVNMEAILLTCLLSVIVDRLSPLQRSGKQGNKSACCTGCQMGSTLKNLGGSLCFCPGNAASMGNAQCTECCCKAYNSFKIPTAASTDSTPCQAECLGAPLSLLSTDLLLNHHSTVKCQVIILTCTDVGMIWLQSCCSAVAVALAVTVSVTITASVTVSVADQVYITLMGDVQMTLVMH